MVEALDEGWEVASEDMSAKIGEILDVFFQRWWNVLDQTTSFEKVESLQSHAGSFEDRKSYV